MNSRSSRIIQRLNGLPTVQQRAPRGSNQPQPRSEQGPLDSARGFPGVSARQQAEARVRRAREAVNDLGETAGPFRTKLLGEAVVELQAARRHLRATVDQEAAMGRLKMLKPAIPMLGQTERQAWQRSATTPKRITGRPLQRLRAELFAQEPLCRACVAAGRTTAATIRDHVIPLAEGGSEDPSNIQPLCGPCSDAKTAAESARGRGIF